MDVDINVKIPAIEKLVDYVASGVGSIAGPMLAPWKAGREAKAKQIEARGEVGKQRILDEGQPTSLQIIAKAQTDAHSTPVSTDSIVQGELDIAETVKQRIQFQEQKRQSNIRSVVDHAAHELSGKSVPNREPDHDWAARFFSEVQDVSSEEMQSLWAKVLAGEVERPGNTSLKTLSILRNLDRATANLFRKLCSVCVSVGPDGNEFWDARVPSLGGDATQNALAEYGLNFRALNVLNEHGLIISEYNSQGDYGRLIGLSTLEHSPKKKYFPIYFQGRYWVLLPISERPNDQEFKLSGVALTRSGQELSRVVDIEPMNEYAQKLKKFFEAKNLQMIEADSWQPG